MFKLNETFTKKLFYQLFYYITHNEVILLEGLIEPRGNNYLKLKSFKLMLVIEVTCPRLIYVLY